MGRNPTVGNPKGKSKDFGISVRNHKGYMSKTERSSTGKAEFQGDHCSSNNVCTTCEIGGECSIKTNAIGRQQCEQEETGKSKSQKHTNCNYQNVLERGRANFDNQGFKLWGAAWRHNRKESKKWLRGMLSLLSVLTPWVTVRAENPGANVLFKKPESGGKLEKQIWEYHPINETCESAQWQMWRPVTWSLTTFSLNRKRYRTKSYFAEAKADQEPAAINIKVMSTEYWTPYKSYTEHMKCV